MARPLRVTGLDVPLDPGTGPQANADTTTPLPSTAVVSTEFRFVGTPDGRVWTPLSNDSTYWHDQFPGFDRVVLVARARMSTAPPPGAREVTGPAVSVASLPDFHTPAGLVRALPQAVRTVRRALRDDRLVIADLGMVGLLLAVLARRQGREFGARLVGDPDAVFGEAEVGGRFRSVYRWCFTTAVRAVCRRSAGVLYAARYLEEKYPAGADAVSMVFPSYLVLDDEPPPPRPATDLPVSRLITVGALEQPYKGVDDLLDAVSLLVSRGRDLHLTIVGDGRFRPALAAHARSVGLADRTTFTGWIPNAAVKELLAQSDLFVLASHTEGQPRALIEAMAMGLPCVATRVGGIPDLLPEDVLVAPRSPDQLAARIEAFVNDRAYRRKAAEENLARARAYRPRQQEAALKQFYRAVHARAASARQ